MFFHFTHTHTDKKHTRKNESKIDHCKKVEFWSFTIQNVDMLKRVNIEIKYQLNVLV